MIIEFQKIIYLKLDAAIKSIKLGYIEMIGTAAVIIIDPEFIHYKIIVETFFIKKIAIFFLT